MSGVDEESPHFKSVKIGDLTFKITPLSYQEYSLVKRAKFHPINKRQVVETHAFLEQASNSLVEVSVREFDDQPLLLQKLLEHIYDYTDEFHFLDDDKFPFLVDTTKKHLLTLDGAYDLFVFINLGYDGLVASHENGPQARALMIACLEHITGVDVKNRLNSAIKEGGKLNLNPGENDEQTKNGSRIPEEDLQKAREAGVDIGELDEVSSELRRQLNQEKKNPKKHFNWDKDTAFGDISTARATSNLRPGQ